MSSDKLSMSATGTRQGSAEIEKLIEQMRNSKTPEAALKLLHRSVQLRPNDQGLRLMLACTLHEQGKAGEAEQAYAHCLRANPKNLRALINLGSLQISGGQPAAGMKALNGALYLDPGNEEALAQKARGYGIMGKPEDALKILDDLAKKYPTDPKVMKGQALCHIEIGHKTKAAGILVRAAELAPDDQSIKNTLKKVTS
jgi:Flp pilus assembly protein TadD